MQRRSPRSAPNLRRHALVPEVQQALVPARAATERREYEQPRRRQRLLVSALAEMQVPTPVLKTADAATGPISRPPRTSTSSFRPPPPAARSRLIIEQDDSVVRADRDDRSPTRTPGRHADRLEPGDPGPPPLADRSEVPVEGEKLHALHREYQVQVRALEPQRLPGHGDRAQAGAPQSVLHVGGRSGRPRPRAAMSAQPAESSRSSACSVRYFSGS